MQALQRGDVMHHVASSFVKRLHAAIVPRLGGAAAGGEGLSKNNPDGPLRPEILG